MEAQKSSILRDETIRALTSRWQGQLIRPGDDQYNEARAVWNGMIDKHPALIARCATVADVITAVHFARENDLLVAVRGGGHNVAGCAVCDDGLVIDLSSLPLLSISAHRCRMFKRNRSLMRTTRQAFCATTGNRSTWTA